MNNLVFIDIETIPGRDYDESIAKKMTLEEYSKVVSLKGQYCKIVCISWAFSGELPKSVCVVNEKELLTTFIKKLSEDLKEKGISSIQFVGHNIIGFDLPVIFQRFLSNGIKVPYAFRFYGKKPWDITHIDTMLVWKSIGTSVVSMDDLYFCLYNKPGKDDMDGSKVYDAYKAGELEKIARYCEMDVQKSMFIFDKLKELGGL